MRRQRNIKILVGIQQQQQQHSGNKCKIFGLRFSKINRTGPEKHQCESFQNDFMKTHCLCLFDEI